MQGKKNRDFVQSFFLAVQDKGYFVLNDTFRYLASRNSTTPTPHPKDAFHAQPYDKPAYAVRPPFSSCFLQVAICKTYEL